MREENGKYTLDKDLNGMPQLCTYDNEFHSKIVIRFVDGNVCCDDIVIDTLSHNFIQKIANAVSANWGEHDGITAEQRQEARGLPL